ncbi:MMPL family transporter [Conexibacter sp. DBS9H8]|uniref:MMPL family transporter n=1 Tax=Conexibacter sp. DBS9H8 TaxID=2937801 RepID=UPI0020107202|nr:MMPL family transporter [Conexibacter sp. DBS9H8]
MTERLDALIGLARRRPRSVLVIVGIVAFACAIAALGLTPSSNIDTLVSSSSADYRATQQDAAAFGAAPVVVLVRAPLSTLLGAHDIGVLSQLEACLAGQQVSYSSSLSAFVPVPAVRATPYGGRHSPCGALMASRVVKVVYGPATFLNQAVRAISRELTTLLGSVKSAVTAKEQEAAALARRQRLSAADTRALIQAAGAEEQNIQEQQLVKLAASAGLSLADLPSITNSALIDKIVFAGAGSSTPKARFSYLFPSADAALIQVRLRGDLDSAQTAAAIRAIRAVTRMPRFRLSGASYLVSGEPVVLNDLAASLSGQVAALLVGANLVMAVMLAGIFRRRLALLPLALALIAAAITFGLSALAGGTLTMGSIAVLPVLIGLAVDYGIQFQSRASGAATIAAAALATATGFLVLLLSPVPLVRGFGLLLVLGVAVAFLVVLTAGAAVLGLGASPGGGRRSGPLSLPGWLRGAADQLGASVRGAGEILAGARPRRRTPTAERQLGRLGHSLGRRGWSLAGLSGPNLDPVRLTRRPRTVLAVGLALALLGWVADTQTAVQSDITKLVPANLPALHDLNVLERTTGTSGELDVLVHAADVATPATLSWMVAYEQAIVRHFGYRSATGCFIASVSVCPALSLPDLFAGTGSSVNVATITSAQVSTLLATIPPYFSQAVITPNRTFAALSFGIRLMPLAKQRRVIAYMRAHLHPPRGVTARLAGLPVLAADAEGALASPSRRLLTLVAGLAAVAVMLTVIFRRPRRALVPLVPIVLATGWSALIVWLIGIPLNPMSATLGALVIAISTEFSVLLSERFRRQRIDGDAPAAALTNAYRSTGRAVLASGVTAIAGFAVLIVSNVTMLRDFGLVTLIDMSVSLLGVLAVLPAVLTLSDPDRSAVAALGRGWWRRPGRPRPGRPGDGSGGPGRRHGRAGAHEVPA